VREGLLLLLLYITLFTSLCFSSPICITKNLSAKPWVQCDGHSGLNPLFLFFFWPPTIHSARRAADGGRTSPPMIVSSLLVFFRLYHLYNSIEVYITTEINL
jgi:hypothetical protein